jgi:hypothetical protein
LAVCDVGRSVVFGWFCWGFGVAGFWVLILWGVLLFGRSLGSSMLANCETVPYTSCIGITADIPKG